MAKIPRPRPEVYRLAAELIMDESLRIQGSCTAIQKACSRLRVPGFTRRLHLAMYSAMFKNGNMAKIRMNIRPEVGVAFDDTTPWSWDKHPYWNRVYSKGNQEMRATALLLMAEIVENPCYQD